MLDESTAGIPSSTASIGRSILEYVIVTISALITFSILQLVHIPMVSHLRDSNPWIAVPVQLLIFLAIVVFFRLSILGLKNFYWFR